LLSLQLIRPGWLTFGFGVVAVLAASLATRLQLRTEFTALLPEQAPSVLELRRVVRNLPASSKLYVVLEGNSPTMLREYGDRLVSRLRAHGPPTVVAAEDGIQQALHFLLPRALLFADRSQLEALEREVQVKWNRDLMRAAGLDLGLDDEPGTVTDDLKEWSRLEQKLQSRWGRFPSGYFQSANGSALVVVVHTAIAPGAIEQGRAALDKVKDVVSDVLREVPPNSVRVGYAGDLVTGLSEYGAMRDDLLRVGALGFGLILVSIFLYYMHFRALVALALAISAGCAWTFAATELLIGYLNVATGFLFSIVAGNGINFGIIMLGRFYEELRAGRATLEAISVARKATWLPTLTAALAAVAAYASLVVSEFQGLKQFALIGALGMLLCWLATYLMLPSLLALFHRDPARPQTPTRQRAWRDGLHYSAPFAWLIHRAPRTILAIGAIATLVSVFFVARSIGHDPMEYQMKRLFNQLDEAREQQRLSGVARDIIGVANESSMAILCDRVDQVGPLSVALQARWQAAPADAKPFEAVHSIDELVPREQPEKIAILMRIRDRVVRAERQGLIAPETWKRWEPYLPPDELEPFGIYDLPEAVARPFAERDGRRGRIVYIEPTHGADEDDIRYLMRWADSFRATRLDTGETVMGSGRIVIFADMMSAVLRDMPVASLLSFLMTAAVVLVTARRRRDATLILGSLLMGVLWVAGCFAGLGLKLNFLNFMALPITFGIGVDYAVNFVQRYRENPQVGPIAALRSSGGAVILCSLTTSIGYLALLGSKNRAVHSLGLLSVLGEVACLLAALLVMPAWLVLARKSVRAKSVRAAGFEQTIPPARTSGAGTGPSNNRAPAH